MFNNKFNIGVLKHPGYNIGGGIGEAALIGAAMGGAKSLATGDDVLEGALLGGITGGAMSGITGAIMGGAASGAATTTGQVAKDAVTGQALASSVPGTTGVGAFTNAINSGANVTDDVLAQAIAQPSQIANAGLTGMPITNAGGMANAGLTQGAGLKAAEQAIQEQALANTGQTALSSSVASQTPQGVAAFTAPETASQGIRGALGLKPDSLVSQGLDWYGKQDLLTKAGLGGAAGYTMGALEPRPIPKLEEEEESKLHGYDPDNFTPYIPETPNPYYKAKYAAEGGEMRSYAQGGIAALANGGMGGNMDYPQGRLDTTQYATPSQMPTSAEVVNTGYEMQTDPYMGTPVGMAQGGVARYFGGGIPQARNLSELTAGTGNQVYYDPQKGQYYTQVSNPMGIFNMIPGVNGAFGDSDGRQYIGADGRPVEGGVGGKLGGSMLDSSFKATQATPEVYKQAYQPQQAGQTPMTDYNPVAAATAAQSVTSPAYDAMMQGVAPQDFNRVFSQVMGQQPQATQAQAVPVAVQAPQEEKQMASGGITGYNLGGYASGGNPRLLKGPGDGMSDNIPATIGNKQPARLADGEFVVPADVVSHLGNGSTDAGAKHLYKMMDKVRTARTGKKAQGKQIKPEKFLPR